MGRIVDECIGDSSVDALAMSLIYACLNSVAASSAAASPIIALCLKGSIVKHLHEARREVEGIELTRSKTVVKLFHALMTEILLSSWADPAVVSVGAEIERLSDELVGFLRMVAEPELPQADCMRLLVMLWNRYRRRV